MTTLKTFNLPLAAIATATFLLSACGVAETGAVAAAQGGTAAEQAKEAQKTKEKVEQDVAAAEKTAADARAKAEEEAGQ